MKTETTVVDKVATAPLTLPRTILHRTRGRTHGPITRLVSPSDVGQLIKPFVFLDSFVMEADAKPLNMGWHPHSGIATVTVMLEGSASYEETTGVKGVLPAGGIEFMRAGSGVWHTGGPGEPGRVKGFQLWLALPPDLENGPPASHYVMPADVPADGPVRVILGSYAGMRSPITEAPAGLTYLSVSLKAGEKWTFTPEPGHTVAWVAVHQGVLHTPAAVRQGEMAVFEASDEPIEFVAEGDTGFVLGAAVKHPHDLVLGSYSVHTTPEALARGEREIRRIGTKLQAEGVLRR